MQSDKSIYGIIGNPVSHSLSPIMHNTAFAELNVPARYELFPLEEDELDGFFEELKKDTSPIFGLNVTVPYKEKVLKYLDLTTPLVEKLQAVNTIVIKEDRKLIGYNTDAPGFIVHLSELKFEIKDKRVAILGAGGSARAIIATLCMIPERPESIKIYNRTYSRIDKLLADLESRIDVSIVEPVNTIDDLNIELCDLLINTTSVGLNENDPCLVSQELLNSNILVYDLIYKPKETPLLKLARSQGAQTANGLGMLFYQGVLALQHWAQMPIGDEIKAKMRISLEKAAE